MKTVLKAALGALALASFGFAASPAGAVTTTTTTITVQRNCMMPGCVRPGFYRHEARLRHDMLVMRREAMLRELRRHERHEAMRQAFLEHRYETRGY